MTKVQVDAIRDVAEHDVGGGSRLDVSGAVDF